MLIVAMRRARRLIVLVAGIALLLSGCGFPGLEEAPPTSVAPTTTTPPAAPEGARQLVTVTVASAKSTSGTLQAWDHHGDGWTSVLGVVPVRVGVAGVGPTHEGLDRTPIGTFGLPSAFGRLPNPGSRMPYRQVGESDWWVSDSASADYNTYQHCARGSCPFDERVGENLGDAGDSYDYAVVIGYNTDHPAPGAGSAFFVHVDAGESSEGCVEVPRASMVALLRWLDPARTPAISIGYT
ncbi:L,D-transpeptidase family protein [Nocardia sp. NPDC051570]|uniref:L,D-transpeptidase family protein n=1 Tax=Nocardia sp. NPDC051570 TaxID=3364324 RepID=UPI0037A8015B